MRYADELESLDIAGYVHRDPQDQPACSDLVKCAAEAPDPGIEGGPAAMGLWPARVSGQASRYSPGVVP